LNYGRMNNIMYSQIPIDCFGKMKGKFD